MFSKIVPVLFIFACSANCIAQSPTTVAAKPVAVSTTTVTNRATAAPSLKNISTSPKEVKKRKTTAHVTAAKKSVTPATPGAK